MRKLMTRHFAKWIKKQSIPQDYLKSALEEVFENKYEADLGGNIIKKRLRFPGKGKSGSGRTIICYKREHLAIFIHGFAKNEKSDLTSKEQIAFKELAKVLLSLTDEQITKAMKNGDFKEI